MYEPVIKWTGSKRSQALEILKFFPKEINTYYEPFCGGASVLRRVLSNTNIKVEKYICSDINYDLIQLWNQIKLNPLELTKHYKILWEELNKDNDIERKKSFYNKIRTRYNDLHNPFDFMFIMRTTTNGMPRYNKNGEFNNSFHVTRNGIQPSKLKKIVFEWSELLNEKKVEFNHCSFENIRPKKDDFMYLDPPYFNAKGMYYGRLDYEKLWNWLSKVPSKYILSFDGKSGEDDRTQKIPACLYSEHKYILNGNSSFKRTMGKSKNSKVYESLYIK